MSLANALQEIKEGAKQRVPQETLELMATATNELRESGIMEQARNIGDKLPPFELVDSSGLLVSSKDLLQKGPLVMTFYRGDW